MGVDHFDDHVRSEAIVRLALRRRELDSGQAVLAVPELRGDQLLIQRMLGAACNNDIATPS